MWDLKLEVIILDTSWWQNQQKNYLFKTFGHDLRILNFQEIDLLRLDLEKEILNILVCPVQSFIQILGQAVIKTSLSKICDVRVH